MTTFDDTLPIAQAKHATRSIEEIRQDFPILSRQVHDRPLVYLDSTASSQKPTAVIEAMNHYYQAYNANIHRGVYQISEEATAGDGQGTCEDSSFHQCTPEQAGHFHAQYYREYQSRGL